jgi:hypothetical protein
MEGVYVWLSDPDVSVEIHSSREVADGVVVDVAADGSLVGVELLDATAVAIDGQRVKIPGQTR